MKCFTEPLGRDGVGTGSLAVFALVLGLPMVFAAPLSAAPPSGAPGANDALQACASGPGALGRFPLNSYLEGVCLDSGLSVGAGLLYIA